MRVQLSIFIWFSFMLLAKGGSAQELYPRAKIIKSSRFQLNLEFVSPDEFGPETKFITNLDILDSTKTKILWSHAYDQKLTQSGSTSQILFITDTLNTKVFALAKITFVEKLKVNKFKHYAATTLLPGASLKQLDNRNHLLNGVLGYLCVGGAIASNYFTNLNYSDYLAARSIDARNTKFKNTQIFRYVTIGLSGTASLVWLKNYRSTYKKIKRLNEENIKEISPYYYEKNITNSKTYRTYTYDFDLRDDVTILYELASSKMMANELDEALKLSEALSKVSPSSKKAINLNIEIQKRIKIRNRDLIKYKILIETADSLKGLKKWNEARAKLNTADKIYLNDNEPQAKIREINTLEKEEQLDQQCKNLIDQGDVQLSFKNYISAIKFYDDALNLNHCNRLAQNRINTAKGEQTSKLTILADKLFTAEKFEEAKAQYEEILRIDPNDKNASDKLTAIDRLAIYKTDENSIPEILYTNRKFKVDIRFYIVSNACASYFSTFQYRIFNISSRPYGITKISFDLDYVNCYGNKNSKTFVIDISDDPTGSSGYIDGPDKIPTERVTKRPYNIRAY